MGEHYTVSCNVSIYLTMPRGQRIVTSAGRRVGRCPYLNGGVVVVKPGRDAIIKRCVDTLIDGEPPTSVFNQVEIILGAAGYWDVLDILRYSLDDLNEHTWAKASCP